MKYHRARNLEFILTPRKLGKKIVSAKRGKGSYVRKSRNKKKGD